MSKNNGGPAFPCQYQGDTRSDMSGLSIRDYFAAKAMQGMNANEFFNADDWQSIAEYAYEMADAMLAEREAVK